jgi:biopolymer transport protein ExbD
MIRKKNTLPEVEKLNLVPIMDAVFIFIFFLLFSAQFIKMYEIETDAPLISEVPQDQKIEKDPLNLTVKVLKNIIELRTGVDQNVHATFFKSTKNYLVELKKTVMKLRVKHPSEDYVIIAPIALIQYEEIVNLIDSVQKLPDNKKSLVITKNGKVQKIDKIFKQIVLEPLDES